jgi:hypothetical protein
MARRVARKSRPESLLEIVQRIEVEAARAQTEAAENETIDPWDLLDLDERVSGPAWERFMRGRPH